MRMISIVKARNVNYLKFGDSVFISLTMLGLEAKSSSSSMKINENPLLYCRKFSVFAVAVIV